MWWPVPGRGKVATMPSPTSSAMVMSISLVFLHHRLHKNVESCCATLHKTTLPTVPLPPRPCIITITLALLNQISSKPSPSASTCVQWLISSISRCGAGAFFATARLRLAPPMAYRVLVQFPEFEI